MNETSNQNMDNSMSQASNQDMDNSIKQTMKSELPKLALDEIPNASADALSITGIVKKRGRISGYQLSNDQIVSREEGVELAKNGQIKGVGIAHNRDTEYLKAIPDGNENNNLSSLPRVNRFF